MVFIFSFEKESKSVFLAIGMVAISVMLFNMPFSYRNFIAARSIFGSKDLVSETRNDGSLIEAAFLNSVRNFAIELNTPIDVINGFNTKVTTRLLKLFGINANNSQNTWPGTFFVVYKNTGHRALVVCLLSFIHLRNLQALYRKMQRVVKKNDLTGLSQLGEKIQEQDGNYSKRRPL